MTGVVLVFGETGQVARELANIPPPKGLHLEFAGRARCNLLTEDAARLIADLRPQAVINASAYTAVDRAESEPDAAFRLNRDVVAQMATACAEARLPFVHISTDYVFDGEKPSPYVETDARCPLSVYGASKAAGEEAVEQAGGAATVLRTAWVFSPYGANFIKTMRRLASERDEVSVVADQWGRPTLAADIAAMAMQAVQRGLDRDHALNGLFHLAGADDAVWADVAEHVFQQSERSFGKRPELKRITTADYPTPAKRPANSRLETRKLQHVANWKPRPWRETVDLCMTALD